MRHSGPLPQAEEDEEDEVYFPNDPPGTVRINIYDLHKSVQGMNTFMTDYLNLGAFHVGVELYSGEYMFTGAIDETAQEKMKRIAGQATVDEVRVYEYNINQTGIIRHYPRAHMVHAFKESIIIGTTPLSFEEVRAVVNQMSTTWLRGKYSLVDCNCVHFCDALLAKLHVPPVPSHLYGMCRGAANVRNSVVAGLGLMANAIGNMLAPSAANEDSEDDAEPSASGPTLEEHSAPSTSHRLSRDQIVPQETTAPASGRTFV